MTPGDHAQGPQALDMGISLLTVNSTTSVRGTFTAGKVLLLLLLNAE